MIPAVAELHGWMRLRRLREYLQRQGRLLEARAVLDQEVGHTPDGSEQEIACRSLLEACANQENSEEPIWTITGRSKLRLGQILMAGGQVEARDDAFQGARRALEAAWASGHENNSLLLVRLAELKALDHSGHQGVLQAYDEFVQCANVRKDKYVHSTALSRACSIALVQFSSEKSPSNLKTFWQWSRKAESILKELGDIAYLLIFRLASGDIACTMEADFGAVLKWHEDFELKHPSFHLWRQKTAIRKTKLFIYNRLNDEDSIYRTLAEMKSVAADQDEFWSDDGFRKQADIKASSENREPDRTSASAAFQRVDPDMEWVLEWSKEMPVFMNSGWKKSAVQIDPDSVRVSSILEVILCSWIKEEFQAGILTKQDVTDILSFDLNGDADMTQVTKSLDDDHFKQDGPKEHTEHAVKSETSNLENKSNSTLEDEVTSLKPETLSCRLYGTKAASASESRWERAYSTLSDWLLRKSTRSQARRHFLLFQVQSQRLSYVIDSTMPYELRALEAERLIALFPKLNPKVQEYVSSNIAYWRSTIASAKYLVYINSRGHVMLDMHSSELKEIMELYHQSLADNREKNGLLLRDVHINMDMANVYFYAAAKLDQIAFEGLMNSAARAMLAFEKIRAGWRALTGWDRVRKLLSALEEGRILQIAPTVVSVVCEIPESNREVRNKLIWDMIQFAKSIGISWLMESNGADAREQAAEGRDDDQIHIEAVGLQGNPRKPSDSKGNFNTQPDPGQNSEEDITRNQQQVNAKAKAAVADDHVEDQTNTSLDTEKLQADLQNINHLGGDAVFVDWYNSACGLAESPRPVITTLSGTNEGPRCSLASITWKQVDKLVNAFMELATDELENDEYTEFLYGLNPLVEPLAWTKPGQTLVFSPCGNLHRIPLHALKIDGEVIIKRNPVVYCSSLSTLVNAYHLRVPVEPHSSTGLTADISSIETSDSSLREYSNSKVSLFGPPTPNGKAALEAAATKFKAKAHTHDNFTASSFTSTIQDPRLHLLHYHGHANFDSNAPEDHCLLFHDRALTLKDIFDLPSPLSHGGGFHVTLLGCGSGMSKTRLTDDVIGLVPSLLYAGASSTVSTLWPFSDTDAAEYSESIYEGFFGGGAEVGEGMAGEILSAAGGVVVDLAKANQKAVLGIMQRKPALYHWAPFVLNGYWMMRSPHGK